MDREFIIFKKNKTLDYYTTFDYLHIMFIEVNPVYFDFFVEVNHGQVLYYGSYSGFSKNLLNFFRDKWKTIEVIQCQTKKYWSKSWSFIEVNHGQTKSYWIYSVSGKKVLNLIHYWSYYFPPSRENVGKVGFFGKKLKNKKLCQI